MVCELLLFLKFKKLPMQIKSILLFSFALAGFSAFSQTITCAGKSVLYSREIFRDAMTFERAVALSGMETSCNEEETADNLTLPTFKNTASPKPYQYSQIDVVQQDANGRDAVLGVVTDVLVNYLIYDRK